jgi:hypothetical protein
MRSAMSDASWVALAVASDEAALDTPPTNNPATPSMPKANITIVTMTSIKLKPAVALTRQLPPRKRESVFIDIASYKLGGRTRGSAGNNLGSYPAAAVNHQTILVTAAVKKPKRTIGIAAVDIDQPPLSVVGEVVE